MVHYFPKIGGMRYGTGSSRLRHDDIGDRVITDNGSCYRSFEFVRTCKRLGIQTAQGGVLSPQEDRLCITSISGRQTR